MKRKIVFLIVIMSLMGIFIGCGEKTDPGTPPANVVQGNNNSNNSSNNELTGKSTNKSKNFDGSVMEKAVTINIGRDVERKYDVNMYNNAAVDTMLGYLTSSDLLFPSYTYDAEVGFSAQNIRGSYTKNDEKKVTDIKAGELYLFSDGQLRLYFKDVAGADITATPVGSLANADSVKDAVTSAYEENKGDSWGVIVYYHIVKN